MKSSLGFYLKPKTLQANSFEDNDIFDNEEEDDEDLDNQGYLQEVPYTSSSVDRSSIGSIPWADDAIKINKLEWERVEKMLSGLEPITVEDDLSKEILDWQKKFPQLLNKSKYKMKNLSSDSLDIESLPSLDLTSEEEDEEPDDKTLTRDRVKDISITPTLSIRKSSQEDSNNLCQLMDNFTLKSVPLKLSQRETNRTVINKRKCASSTSSYSLRSPPTPIQQVPSATAINTRFRMPPILNVLDSRRKFRSLGQNKNPSFVQLTQIQQAKSAAVAQEQKPRTRFHTGHRSAWHVPLAANRFCNNRNSIILPSLSSRQQVIPQYSTQPTTTSTTSDLGTSNTTPSSTGPRVNLLRTNNNNYNSHNLTTKRQFVLGGFSTNASTQTNTLNTTSGRSISAAVQYPRINNFNALHLPYSASKFHAFK